MRVAVPVPDATPFSSPPTLTG